MTIRKEFLGRGFAFPFHFDLANGGVALSEYEENIRQNISIIVGTRPGERQMLPNFGCRIHELLFAPDTRATAMTAARHVEEAIRMWERRVEVEKVDARIDVSGAIRVEVVYKITSTGAVERLEHLVSSTPGSAGPPAPR
jgi:phage baseplate assembly protein W